MLYVIGSKREKSFNCLLLDWSGGCRVCRAGSATPVYVAVAICDRWHNAACLNEKDLSIS